MSNLSRLRIIKWVIAGLALTLMVGCSDVPSDPSNQTNPPNQTNLSNPADTSNSSSPSESPNSSTEQTDSENKLLADIMQSAKTGKVINSEYAAKTTVIEDVKEKWGEPAKSDYVAAAKGTYDTYSKYNVVFGFNKGSQIFEVRSFDDQLKKLTLSKVKKNFGSPAYTAHANGEDILGYVVSQDFKILLVFPKVSSTNTDPILDHYSVLYPQGTVNSMANSPGRQW